MNSRSVLIAAVCLLAATAGCSTEVTSTSPATSAPLSASIPQSATQQPPAATSPSSDYRISIPEINAESTLIPLGLNADKTLATPSVDRPEQASVYSGGPTPGDTGPAVILGHVNGNGRPGVFANLNQLRTGQTFSVRRPDGETVQFEIYRVQQVNKSDFPTAQVYSDTQEPEVRLITCGGALNRAARSYDDNIIVYARAT